MSFFTQRFLFSRTEFRINNIKTGVYRKKLSQNWKTFAKKGTFNDFPQIFHGHFLVFTHAIFVFFSRLKIWFSRKRFFQNFHGHFGFFTCTFWILFTHTLDFSRKQLQKFSRKEVRFSRKKKTLLQRNVSSIEIYNRRIVRSYH